MYLIILSFIYWYFLLLEEHPDFRVLCLKGQLVNLCRGTQGMSVEVY